MLNDDLERGRILSRRELLVALGAAGALLAARGAGATQASNLPGCVVRPEQTEGPYFLDPTLRRSDIRSDPADGSVRPGAPLDLTFRVSRLDGGGCAPLAGAHVDLWQCDHRGIYSGVSDPGFDTEGQRFLRGYQVTDRRGVAQFTTIYPGWYPGRTVHVHFKIRSSPSASPGFEFTSQLYFDDELTDKVHAQPPYSDQGQRRRRNSSDGIFRRGGAQLLLDLVPGDPGYAATFEIALQL